MSNEEKARNAPGCSNGVSSIKLVRPIPLQANLQLELKNNSEFHRRTSSMTTCNIPIPTTVPPGRYVDDFRYLHFTSLPGVGNNDTLGHASQSMCSKSYLCMRIQGMKRDVSKITRAVGRRWTEGWGSNLVNQSESKLLFGVRRRWLYRSWRGAWDGVGDVARGRGIR